MTEQMDALVTDFIHAGGEFFAAKLTSRNGAFGVHLKIDR
jgi:hypothetical protein